jgi:phosphoribosylanthranilate isomerase
MLVKICGITNREDAEAAVEAGASALGFIFHPQSPRFVTSEQAAHLADGLPVLKVGVFVDQAPARVAETMRQAGLDVAQLHGSETAAQYPAGVRVWKAQRVTHAVSIPEDDPAEAWLLDGPSSGVPFDWGLAAGLPKRIILAGGLDAGNVRQAVERVRPWGVDACSRLESSPGRKDHTKMLEFLKAALA